MEENHELHTHAFGAIISWERAEKGRQKEKEELALSAAKKKKGSIFCSFCIYAA